MRRSIVAAAVQSSPRFRGATIGRDARLSRQHSPQLDIVVLGGQTDVVAAVGEQTDGAVEMAHVRQPADDEQNAH